jgi:hypothetical protein
MPGRQFPAAYPSIFPKKPIFGPVFIPFPIKPTMKQHLKWTAVAFAALGACQSAPEQTEAPASPKSLADAVYTQVKLTTDTAQLSASEKKMIPLLIEAAQIMDKLFWQEAVGGKEAVLSGIADEQLRRYAEINYGPWDRLGNDTPFVASYGPKPAGAQFYPADMTKEEFEASDLPKEAKESLYTMIRRDEAGKLEAIPYHEYFKEDIERAADLLRQAAALCEEPQLKRYLELRAQALLTDDYRESDLAWMDMQENGLDVIIGPIETYEDKLFGYKAAHEAYILVKDKAWSEKLKKYAALLPELQRGLPVEEAYKREVPGSNSQLNAYDVVYYAGDCNAGSKTIAVNLPNDEAIQLEKGTRRSQLKNAMRAKFDKILVPIADLLIVPEQRKHITFDAFFANTMFHEVAHGLGIKETVNGKGPVRKALQEQASALEEGKADILGLYMVTSLLEQGHLSEGTLEDYYITFMASIFRSVRFGAASAHGKANMIRFNYFLEKGAFAREESGLYRVDMAKMREAMNGLSELILKLQGDGDYEGVVRLMEEKGAVGGALQGDLDRLAQAGIPVDIVFEQGAAALGL